MASTLTKVLLADSTVSSAWLTNEYGEIRGDPPAMGQRSSKARPSAAKRGVACPPQWLPVLLTTASPSYSVQYTPDQAVEQVSTFLSKPLSKPSLLPPSPPPPSPPPPSPPPPSPPLASKLAEANQPVACPLQWLPVLLTRIPMPPTHHRRLLNNIFTSKAVLAANADSEELAADLLDTEGQGPALRSVMAHRGSPGFEAMLLAQLDTATKEARLPCSVQQGVNWPLAYLEPHATWGAASCLARCARHDKCVAYGFAPPPKDSELPGRRARLST